MKIHIKKDLANWNEYILKERGNKFGGITIKKNDFWAVKESIDNIQYNGNYPIKITFIKYFKDRRQDLDNVRIKGILDGLVKCKVIENDNLNKIREITLKSVIDKNKSGIDIIIEEWTEKDRVDGDSI